MQENDVKFWGQVIDKQLKYRHWILGVMSLLTLFFLYNAIYKLEVVTDFFDLYPPEHEYIQLYNEFRDMFGSANEMNLILERTDGKDIYNPETLGKLDELTKGVLGLRGVNPLQVSSAVHPRVKQIVIRAYGPDIQPLTFPSIGYPKTKEESLRFRDNVYANEGIRGFYVGMDDRSAVVYAAFWEEGLDFAYLYPAIQELKASIEDESHQVHISGYPMLYSYMDYYKFHLVVVLLFTVAFIIITLALYFKNSRGVTIPLFSGALSGIWGLGFAAVTGFNLDPLLLVIPILLSARALSHSLQCMERYHQEYAVIGDKRQAIRKAYGALYPPCIAGAITDGLGVLTIAIASIPLMQKIAYVASFWVISILVAVAILNPIILYFLPAPDPRDKVRLKSWLGKKAKPTFWSRCYEGVTTLMVSMSGPRSKWAMIAVIFLLLVPGLYTITHLKVGDSSAGGAILYADHPYNVASQKMNEDFLGESKLTVVVKGRETGAIRDRTSLYEMENLARFLENEIDNVGGTLSIVNMIRNINRAYHDGSPKWEMVPDHDRDLGAIFFLLASSMAPGEMDQFISLPDYTHSNVTAFFRDYDYLTIKNAIEQTREFSQRINEDPESKIEIKLAGGILGILAAVNEEVEWSYWAIFIVIFSTIFVICLTLYRSFKAALILIIPVFVAQVMCDLFMMAYGIDLNINSLPVASVGVGVGIDYGIYLMSRLKEECGKTSDWETAKLVALTTTGKVIMFTALTIVVALIPWLFSPIKFQAEMGLLILLLMVFNMVGALVFIPSLTAVLKPNFVKRMEMRT